MPYHINYKEGRGPGAETYGNSGGRITVSSKRLGGGDGAAYASPQFQK